MVDDSELASLTPPYSSVALRHGAHLVIDPDDPIRFGNHSCDPNLWMVGAVEVVARSSIAPGAELTVDYATQTGVPWWSMACACGSALCREVITGKDWRLASLRRAYRGRVLFAGAVVAFLLTLPLVNLVMPIVATGFMRHVFEGLRRRADAQDLLSG